MIRLVYIFTCLKKTDFFMITITIYIYIFSGFKPEYIMAKILNVMNKEV